ncbi:flagellar type III secretion system protein FlhB [Methylovorus menthalis]|uniref:flagellar biosynthesis protein FlhB n=1 Tax=Methylovorus menthalis TaxID=1002227 RepID=UPI001E2F0566|nr:flagellar biosynthesis protein FlhB [Methylovorus menthalis]MCB4812317.1 flagellar type III secretion system protein FlhB [Methylovorus menthalis]
MAEDSDLEKTEPATPKRLEKAREEGNVPRSREFVTCAMLLAGGMGIAMMSSQFGDALKHTMGGSLHFERALAYDSNLLLMKISDSIYSLLITFAPLAGLLFIMAIAAPTLIGGWNVSNQAFVPKFNRLNPMSGLGNMVSKNALVELLKAVGKTILVGSVAYVVVAHDVDTILSLALLPLHTSIAEVEDMLLKSFFFIVGALVLIAAIDVPYQLTSYANKLKMTKEEVKQEAKESEGNPQIKARIRQQQREIARRRMMSEIPKADVVITNPTHYAVAIQYKELGMRAPVVIAKGADAVALKIREIAADHKIMTLESPKLARALYAHTELGDEIPQALYSAVAEIIAYVFQMRAFNKHGGSRPETPTQLDVPDALDPHHKLTEVTA